MQDLTRCLTRAITEHHLREAMHNSNRCNPVTVWTLDGQGKLQAGHALPAYMTPCVLLDALTGALDLYHGQSYVKNVATLTV